MNKRKGKWSSIGFASIEAAAAVVVLMTGFLSAFALVEAFEEQNYLADIIESSSFNTNLGTLKANLSQGKIEFAVDDQELERYVDRVVSSLETTISEHFEQQNRQSRYYIEAQYARLEVDPGSGIAESAPIYAESVAVGDKGILSSEIEQVTNIRTAIETKSNQKDIKGRSVWANSLKSSLNGRNSTDIYLPAVVFAGVRVVVEPRQGFVRAIKSLIKDEPMHYATKVVTLRGDVNL